MTLLKRNRLVCRVLRVFLRSARYMMVAITSSCKLNECLWKSNKNCNRVALGSPCFFFTCILEQNVHVVSPVTIFITRFMSLLASFCIPNHFMGIFPPFSFSAYKNSSQKYVQVKHERKCDISYSFL